MRNQDGDIRLSTSIPLDDFGPPFGYKELVIVPGFDERDMQPGESQPTPQGSPGTYEVTYIFSRPELGVTEIRALDLDFINGDSALSLTTPEPRAKGQPSGLRIDVHYKSRDNEDKQCSMVLGANKHGRLSMGIATIQATGYRDAREEANRAFLPFLSKLSFENNVPLEVKSTITREVSTGGQNVQFRIPFAFQPLRHPAEGFHRTDILALVSFYREGMNSTSISYSFLCFYRILEAIYTRRKDIIQTKRVRFEFNRNNRITELDLLGLTHRLEGYHGFIGRKFRSIYDNDLTPLRVTIAHGLLGTDNPFENTPDDVAMRTRASFLIPITQILARIEILNELTHKEIPLSSETKSDDDSD